MSINNFLPNKKFSKVKKSSIKDTFSSKLNDSLNSQFKRASELDYFESPSNFGYRHNDHNDRREQDEQQEYDQGNVKPFHKNESIKNRNKTLEDDTTRQIEFQTDISAIGRKDNKSKSKFDLSSRHMVDRKEQSNFKQGKQKVEGLVEELFQESLVQLENVNKIIDSFNKKISSLIESQFKKFKSAIIDTIETIFESSSSRFKKVFQSEKQRCLNQILETKSELESINDNLESMKREVRGAGWKRVQEELISANIQKQLNDLISEVQQFKTAPAINIRLDRKKMANYEQALVGLLELNDDGMMRSHKK